MLQFYEILLPHQQEVIGIVTDYSSGMLDVGLNPQFLGTHHFYFPQVSIVSSAAFAYLNKEVSCSEKHGIKEKHVPEN